MGPAADNRSSSEQTTDDAAGEAIGERHRLCRALGLGGRYTVRLPASRHRSASTARLPGRVRKRCTSRPIVLRVNTRLTCTSIPESGSQVLWTSVLHEDLARVSTARNTDKSHSGERGFDRLELDEMQSGQVLLLSQSGNPHLVTAHTETRIGLMPEFDFDFQCSREISVSLLVDR